MTVSKSDLLKEAGVRIPAATRTAPATKNAGVSDRIEALLRARDGTHGDYKETARAAQCIKNVLHSFANWSNLTYEQRESIDVIATKLGRIIAGNPNFADHWDDIAGYAKLVSDRIHK